MGHRDLGYDKVPYLYLDSESWVFRHAKIEWAVHLRYLYSLYNRLLAPRKNNPRSHESNALKGYTFSVKCGDNLDFT